MFNRHRNTAESILGLNHLVECPSNNCGDYESLITTVKEKQDVLDKLNSRRSKIASGEIRSLPSAENMMKLIWNDELELFAQRWADQCVKSSSYNETDSCRDLGN
ncbi:unnamed protein product, partial [Brenthis ino]